MLAFSFACISVADRGVQCGRAVRKSVGVRLTPHSGTDIDKHYYFRLRWSDIEQFVLRAQRTGGRQHYRLPTKLSIAGVETINCSRKKLLFHFQALKLLELSIAIHRQADVVTASSDQAMATVKSRLMTHSEILMGLSEVIGPLDMICSFARLSKSLNYVRLITDDFLVLKAAKHPVLAVLQDKFVAKDVYSGGRSFQFNVIPAAT